MAKLKRIVSRGKMKEQLTHLKKMISTYKPFAEAKDLLEKARANGYDEGFRDGLAKGQAIVAARKEEPLIQVVPGV